MKLALLIQMPLLHPGGVEVLVRELILGLGDEHEVYVASQEPSALFAKGEKGGELPIAGHFQVPQGELPTGWNDALIGWLKGCGVELAHFHLAGTFGWRAKSIPHGAVAAVARSGIPVLVTNHQVIRFFGPSAYPHPLWRKVLLSIVRWPAKAYQLLRVKEEICVSKHDEQVMRRSYPGFGGKLRALYHSRLDETVKAEAMPPSRVVLNVATVAFRKGQHVLVEAFCRIAKDFPEWRLRLVGSLTEKACVEKIGRLIEASGCAGQVDLVGPVADPSGEYRNSEIYVQPSLLEGLGLSLQEAMFHGRACLGTKTGGIPELIENEECGVLCEVDSVEKMAEALTRMMADREWRERLGEGTRASILRRGMTKQAMLDAYRRKYQEIIHS